MLQDKVIIITGSSGFLAQGFIDICIKNRAICVLADVNKPKGDDTRSQFIEQYSDAQIESIELDITSIESVSLMISYLHNKYHRIDAVVNNAYPRNKNYGNSFFDVDYSDFCENTNLHLGGYFLVAQQLAKYFKQQKLGNIINISSVYGMIAPRFEIYKDTEMTMPIEYAVIKSGIIQLTKYMASFLKGSGVRINTISPGGIKDNQPDCFKKKYKEYCLNKGMLNPLDVAGALLFLLSDHSNYINGQNIVVDDGFTL